MEANVKTFARFLKSESGASAIEYGLLASLIAAVIVVAVTAVGTTLNASFVSTSSALK